MASVNQGTGRKSSPASFTSMTPPEARAAYEKLAAATPRRAEVETVRDIEIPAETGTFRGRLTVRRRPRFREARCFSFMAAAG